MKQKYSVLPPTSRERFLYDVRWSFRRLLIPGSTTALAATQKPQTLSNRRASQKIYCQCKTRGWLGCQRSKREGCGCVKCAVIIERVLRVIFCASQMTCATGGHEKPLSRYWTDHLPSTSSAVSTCASPTSASSLPTTRKSHNPLSGCQHAAPPARLSGCGQRPSGRRSV